VDPLMAQRMATWVLWAVINTQRRMDAYLNAQRRGAWDQAVEGRGQSWDNSDVRVGVMGRGVMGSGTARLLHAAGEWPQNWGSRVEGGEGWKDWVQLCASPHAPSSLEPRLLTGYAVTAWSRSGGACEDGYTHVHGADALDGFLRTSDILVCLLPLTPETRGILNATTLAKLPRGASIINAARGQHVVEADLLEALDSGAF